jgi:hypothetical protein
VTAVTAKQAAQRAGVSPSLVYLWTTVEKRLPHLRLGRRGSRGRILIEEDDLAAFLAKLKVEGGDEPPPTAKPAKQQFQHLKL